MREQYEHDHLWVTNDGFIEKFVLNSEFGLDRFHCRCK